MQEKEQMNMQNQNEPKAVENEGAQQEKAAQKELKAESEGAQQENKAAHEATEPEKKETTETKPERVRGTTETMGDYASELEDSLRRIHVGDVMDATVVSVDEENVYVDLAYYAPGKIPAYDMSADPGFRITTDVQVGDTFKAIVTSVDDGAGNVQLSKKAADSDFAWEKLIQMKEDKVLITAKVAGVLPAGAIVYVEGIRGFIPASKLDLKYVEDTEPYLGKTVNLLISEVDAENHKLILSAKELLAEAAMQKRSENVKKLSVGSVVEGTVETLKEYGAFIDLGNDLSGLLHVSEISEKRIKHPGAVLKEGQKVTVMINKIENGKISLSMKALEEAKETELEEEAKEYKSEYVPNNPFAALLKDVKIDN